MRQTIEFPFTYDEYRRVQIAHKKGTATLDELAGMTFYLRDTPQEYINKLLSDPEYKQLVEEAND